MFEGLGLALWRAIWRRGLVAGLLIGLMSVLSYSMDQAAWVQGVQWWPGACLALLGGAALARTRWRGGWALLYATALIMGGAGELVGHVLPNVAQLWQAPGDWAWSLHLRAVTLGQRLQTWESALAQGQRVGDTGLFVWLVALLAWGAVAWLAWSALRRRQALAACMPAAILLAANTYFSAQPWQYVLLFVVLMVALIVYTTYSSQNADWDRRGVDYPGDLGLDWITAGVGLCLSVGLLGAAAPVVAAPNSWHLLADVLTSSRREVAATADQLFSGVKPPNTGLVVLVARTPDLTSIGSGVDQSQYTVMWVKVDEPPPVSYPGVPPPPQHYWRSGLYANYTGTGWQPLQGLALAPVPGSGAAVQASGPPPGRYALSQQFEIVAEHGQAQFAVNRPISATIGGSPNRGTVVAASSAAAVTGETADDGTALLAGTASMYSVTSWVIRVSQAELRAASTAYPPAIRAAYLQLPAGLPARVAALAGQITSGATNPYDQAMRLQDYLRRTYAYQLDVPAPPAGRDAVDYFLYEAPGGYCSYFASAMAVMLRTLGVPARVATGYAMGEYDTQRGAYRVVGAAAHAWVEVYFPSYGWVEFEATPARAVFERPLGAAGLASTTPAAPPGSLTPNAPASRQLAIVLGAAVLLLGVAGWAGWQLAARRPPEAPRAQVLRLYRQMRSALARAGLGATASVTADEYLETQASVLSTQPPLLAAVAEATDLFREAAYSPHPVSETQARAAQRRWASARLAWLRLTMTGLAQRLRESKPE